MSKTKAAVMPNLIGMTVGQAIPILEQDGLFGITTWNACSVGSGRTINPNDYLEDRIPDTVPGPAGVVGDSINVAVIIAGC